MKPLIGVTSSMELNEESYYVNTDNINAIRIAGGLPVILPHIDDVDAINQIADGMNGLYLTGGYDIDPTLFGEEPLPNLGIITPSRDKFELLLIKKMMQLDKPVLAICRGCQILNIAMGGDMYQDIYAQTKRSDLLQHQQNAPNYHGSHYVSVVKNSLLNRLTGLESFKVNSFHHQANRGVADPFIISGKANDNIIEAIESTRHSFVLGLQWHPEKMLKSGDLASLKIYQAFVESC